MSCSNFKLSFVLNENFESVLVSTLSFIDVVSKSFYCPFCGVKLTVNGSDDYWSFKHSVRKSHDGTISKNETRLHQLAKNILMTTDHLNVPSYCICGKDIFLQKLMGDTEIHDFQQLAHDVVVSPATSLQYDVSQVFIERNILGFIPDVLLYVNGQYLIVEIAVTHFVDQYKRQQIQKSNISAIEIDLSHLINTDISYPELSKIIIDDFAGKCWLHHISYLQGVDLFREKNQQLYDLYELRQAQLQNRFDDKMLKQHAALTSRIDDTSSSIIVDQESFDPNLKGIQVDENHSRLIYCTECYTINFADDMVVYQYSQGRCRKCQQKLDA